ncbi:MAG: sulfur carrier protein ThiS [Gammaproteobacteria bacterium]|nr:sulfur carrier protein ThiS [Gammaproteobacteria bacterium]
MNILLNGEPKSLPAGTTVARLVEMLQLGEKRLALEINEEIVPRSRFDECAIRANDRVEIVHAVGGG